MKYQLTEASVEALKKVAEGITEFADSLEEEEKSVISAGKLKGKKKSVEPEDLELEEDDDESEEEDSEEEDTEEEEDESENEEDDEDETVTDLELKNLKAALKAYSTKNGRAKAVKLLNKFGKSSQDVKRKDFAKLLKLLKV